MILPHKSAEVVFRTAKGGLLVAVRLTPRAVREEIRGLEQASGGNCHIGVRVRAAPEKGAANAALVKLFAAWSGVPKSSVTVRAGYGSRNKTLHIAGDPGKLAAVIGARLSGSG